ncbi:Alpha/Beta hydrolase protein [Aspergillus undulatus]|uniref:Alpha/Beta hydrolase protein n=1 Tax=Aspergillus undulatus TaxID=1810928 RepID=UPI003CCD2453
MAIKSLLTGLTLLLSIAAAASNDGLTVVTNTGTVTGLINSTTPQVRQFHAIPYARSPTGHLRFMPPEPLAHNRNKQVNATQFPPSCPQFKTAYRGIFQDLQPESTIPNVAQNSTPGAVANSSDENCLYLAVWAPVQTKTEKGLPVIFFVPGGGFITGGLDEDVQKPHHWVQKSQAHIVVIANYRMSIFGWPNAPGLESPNVGILDMRLALEWVKDNIANFGGDPDRIILWGESAGAVMLDMYSYTHHSDMLAAGLHIASGSTITPAASNKSPDLARTNFTYVAEHVGCSGLSSSPKAQLSCMQEVPWRRIADFVGQYLDRQALEDPTMPLLAFTPVPDEVTIFSNYTTRYLEGNYSTLPTILSNCANEASAVYPAGPVYEAYLQNGTWPDQTIINTITLQNFICPTAQTTENRRRIGAPTYRYLYAANITSIPPLPFLGAHHGADIPSVMGAWKDVVGVPPEKEFAGSVGEAMQDALLAFAEDPEGVAERIGWPEAGSGKMLLFGGEGRAVQSVGIEEVDGACKPARSGTYRWSWD